MPARAGTKLERRRARWRTAGFPASPPFHRQSDWRRIARAV